MVLFQCLLILVIILFYFQGISPIAKTLLIFDISFFQPVGLLRAILMAAMWLGRVDDVCRNNINIVWAFPTHLLAVFFIRKKSRMDKILFSDYGDPGFFAGDRIYLVAAENECRCPAHTGNHYIPEFLSISKSESCRKKYCSEGENWIMK